MKRKYRGFVPDWFVDVYADNEAEALNLIAEKIIAELKANPDDHVILWEG